MSKSEGGCQGRKGDKEQRVFEASSKGKQVKEKLMESKKSRGVLKNS